MQTSDSTHGSVAEARLAILHQIKRAGENDGKMLQKAFASDDDYFRMEVPGAKLIPVSFHDIGMKSHEELVTTFGELDIAITTGKDVSVIERCLAKLLGEEGLNIKIV